MRVRNKSNYYILGISFIHAALLILVVFLINNQAYFHWEDSTLSKMATIVKKSVLGIDPKPTKEELLFVNIGYDIETIEARDNYDFPLGKQVVTDREIVGRFLEVLNKAPSYKILFLDIYFDIPTSKDSLLRKQLEKAHNILIASYLQSDTAIRQSVFDAPTALINFQSVEGGDFYRYKAFFHDSLKTIPLRMHEKLSGKRFTGGQYIYERSNAFAFYLNNFTLDYRIRPYDIYESENNYMLVNLGQHLLQLEDAVIHELVKDRIIIVGDFTNSDQHTTIFGQMPGSLIITNAYLALQAEDNKITLPYLLFLFIGFYVLSMFIFSPTDRLKNYLDRLLPHSKALQWILSYLTYATYLTIMAFFSYLIFNSYLHIIFISVYAKVVDWAVERKFYKNLKEKSTYSIS